MEKKKIKLKSFVTQKDFGKTNKLMFDEMTYCNQGRCIERWEK